MIALIDYGSGNIRSVTKALQREGADVQLVSTPEELEKADAVVLPGVGDFGDCARGIKSRGLWEPLQDWMRSGKPFFGICVGYQLLFEESEESPGESGFGFFRGKVKRFRTPGLKVPQIGWNNLEFTGVKHPLWSGLPDEPFVFFVHSYFPAPEDENIVTARTTYGETFAAAAAKENVAGVQFHPEKSQDVGLTILRNFVAAVQ
jgi:glutamine amidotransferase